MTMDRSLTSTTGTAKGVSEPTTAGRARRGRVLAFPADRQASHERGRSRRRAVRHPSPPEVSLHERFLRALDMESRGFVDGAVSSLRAICGEPGLKDDPRLAIGAHYFLGAFLMLKGECEEARRYADEGVFLAWEHNANEELELLDNLSRQLGG